MKLQAKETTYNELIINKSKFLTYIFPVSSLEEAKEKINIYKEKYKDATHVCYAYILDENTFKYYDDGEPSSTAGAPIYQTLKNNNLIYTMCVVIRYFGGTKLGVGGLIKAYTNSCIECLNKANTQIYQVLENISFITSYSNHEKLDYFLRTNNITILEKSFEDSVRIKISATPENIEKIRKNFFNIIEEK